MSVRIQRIRGTTPEVEAATPLTAEFGYDTTKKEMHIGDGATLGGIRIGKKNINEILICAQVVANTNNYDPTGQKHAGTLVISTDASRNITGLVPTTVTETTDGREVTLYNGGSFDAVLVDQSALSTAANRFELGGANLTLAPKTSATLRYRTQGALNRWELKSQTVGSAVANGAIIASKLAASALGGFVGMVNGGLSHSRVGNAETIAIKTLAGTDPTAGDPVLLVFRDATGANGGYIVRTLTAALSFTISSGSSMGVPSGTAFRLWWTAFDTGAGVVLGAINCLSGTQIYPLSGFGIHAGATTAEGGAGAADAAFTMYTAAAQTDKPYIVLGYSTWESGLAAAGTWNTAPSRVQLHGPGAPLPGMPIQVRQNAPGTSASGNTALPIDNTIPQNTEGIEFMTQAIVPSSAANLLEIEHEGLYACAASEFCGVALFKDSDAGAIAATAFFVGAVNDTWTVPLRHARLAGSSASQTFKIRAGPNNSQTFRFNGIVGQLFNGVAASFLKATERMA